MMTPHSDLTEILEMAAQNQLSPQATADLIISEGWVTIHHSIAAQTVSWAASQAEEVIATGKHAETHGQGIWDSPANYAVERKKLIQDNPDVWLNQLAIELGASTWDV